MYFWSLLQSQNKKCIYSTPEDCMPNQKRCQMLSSSNAWDSAWAFLRQSIRFVYQNQGEIIYKLREVKPVENQPFVAKNPAYGNMSADWARLIVQSFDVLQYESSALNLRHHVDAW